MRRLRDTDRLVDGTPCTCELCTELRARRAARVGACLGYLGFMALGAFGASLADANTAIVVILLAFALLVLGLAAALRS